MPSTTAIVARAVSAPDTFAPSARRDGFRLKSSVSCPNLFTRNPSLVRIYFEQLDEERIDADHNNRTLSFKMNIQISLFSALMFFSGFAHADWNCRNKDLEVTCDAKSCSTSDSFTPMSVTITRASLMSICAYSGCWEGQGVTSSSGIFRVTFGRELPFSSASDMKADIAVVIDESDNVAIVKGAGFASPMHCTRARN